MPDVSKKCVSCGKMGVVSKGQYWLVGHGPIDGPFIGFRCEECAKKGKKLFYLTLILSLLIVSAIVLYNI